MCLISELGPSIPMEPGCIGPLLEAFFDDMFTLAFFDDMPHDEIADLLCIYIYMCTYSFVACGNGCGIGILTLEGVNFRPSLLQGYGAYA